MKSKEKTKQKKHESTIGKIIYGFLLFMPLLAIGVTCAYAIFNKNAYKSFDYDNKIDFIDATSTNTLQGNTLYFRYDTSQDTYNYTQQYYYNWISINYEDYIAYYNTLVDYQPDGIQLYSNGSLRLHNPNTNVWTSYNTDIDHNQGIWGNKLTNFSLILKENVTNPFSGGFTKIQVAYQLQQQISNVFYYSIDKVQQSPLFKWAENSVIYTGMANTCNAIDITTPFIPLLMTYWLIISVIYFLYDIILIILHVFHRKIHELEESI